MRWFVNIRMFIFSVILLLNSSCDIKAINNEMDVKYQYSVMETITYNYIRKQHSEEPYILLKNALDSDTNLLLLPIKNQDYGYVVFILNPYFGEDGEILKYIPDDKDFILTEDTLKAIQAEVDIEEHMNQFLTDYVRVNSTLKNESS